MRVLSIEYNSKLTSKFIAAVLVTANKDTFSWFWCIHTKGIQCNEADVKLNVLNTLDISYNETNKRQLCNCFAIVGGFSCAEKDIRKC